MDTNFSLADIAAVMGRDREGGLFGGGGVLAIIIILFLLFSMMGWGGRNNNTGDYGQYATAASQQQILFGQQFGQLNDRLTNMGNGICSLGYDMQGNIAGLGKEVALGQAGITQQIMAGNYQLAQQLADCCCKTQRGIDAINYNVEAKFAALEKSGLERQIADQAAQINRLELAQQMCGVVRYPMSYAYSAGNSPFCGGCGGCCG